MPMAKLDGLIQNIILETLQDRSALLDCLGMKNMHAERLLTVTDQAKQLAEKLHASRIDERKAIYSELVQSITVHPDRIEIVFAADGLTKHLQAELPATSDIVVTRQLTIRRRGQEMKLIIGGTKHRDQDIDQSLISLIARAHHLKTELETGKVSSIKEFARTRGIDHGDARNLIPLAYLAPSIIEDILAGHQPAELTTVRMKELARHLPYLWSGQRQHLGFNA